MSKQSKQKKGFTIIEVVLVLAIAGLIFLMVFFVLPQAMEGQRDAERRQAMSRVQSALVQYQTNNKSKRNNLPSPGKADLNDTSLTDGMGFCADGGEGASNSASACTFVKNYLNVVGAEENTFVDPDGDYYNLVITENWALGSFAGASFSGDSALTAVGEGDDTSPYTITGNNPYAAHVVYIVPGGKCSGEQVIDSGEVRHFAVLYQLSSGVYCGDSD